MSRASRPPRWRATSCRSRWRSSPPTTISGSPRRWTTICKPRSRVPRRRSRRLGTRNARQTGSCGATAEAPMRRLTITVQGWLLLLPAGVLLAAFTHYPAGATLWQSFFSTPKGDRAAVFVGLDNYRDMLDDPVFWRVLANNTWYAIGTIPVSIALALAMALWVNRR